MTKPSKNYGFVRCDSEFEAVGQDLDMSTMGIVKGIPMYQMPDISRELMLLEEQLKFSAKGKEDKHMILTPASARPLPKRCSALRGQRSVFSRTFLRLLPPKKRKPFLKRRDKPSYHC